MLTLLQGFQTQQGTSVLLHVHKARPPDFTDSPLAYVGGITQPVIHSDAQTRTMVGTLCDLVLIDVVSDNIEVTDRLDDLADDLVDYVSGHEHAVSAETVISPVSVRPTELEIGGVPYAGVVVTVNAQIQEGRNW